MTSLECRMKNPQELLAHRPPMLMLDSIQEISSRRCRAVKVVDPDDWYAQEDGSMPGWFGIELMAQTVAAWSGKDNHESGGKASPGYLLGTRRYKSHLPAFPAGTRLEIEARLEFRDASGLGAFDCDIFIDGLVVAAAMLKVFEPPAVQEEG